MMRRHAGENLTISKSMWQSMMCRTLLASHRRRISSHTYIRKVVTAFSDLRIVHAMEKLHLSGHEAQGSRWSIIDLLGAPHVQSHNVSVSANTAQRTQKHKNRNRFCFLSKCNGPTQMHCGAWKREGISVQVTFCQTYWIRTTTTELS